MPTVFVIQNHLRWDAEKGELLPRYNISPAAEFGTLKMVLNPKATLENPQETLQRIDDGLADFKAEDYLLLIGNPVLIGWATSCAASRTGGPIRVLVWSNKDRSYRSVFGVLPVARKENPK